jgi:hypothetical protein
VVTSVRFARASSVAAAKERIPASYFQPSLAAPWEPSDIAVAYKVADTKHERASAFRLVHDVYVKEGLMHRNPFRMRVMPHHLLPTTAVFVAQEAERVIATLSLVGDGRLGLPLEEVYGPEVDQLREPSTWLGEVSALASAPYAADFGFDVVIGLMRLMAQFAQRHGMEHLLVAVHPRHARLYRRTMGFQRLGDERAYPSVCNRPAVALHLDLSRLDQAPAENVALFFGERIPEEELRFCPISAAERHYFASVLACDVKLADAATPGAALACA